MVWPTRLAEQMKSIRESGLAGCVLSRWTIHDATTQRSYISESCTWEGSLVAERAAVPAYPPAKQGGDTPKIDAMMKKKQLTLLERPELYIYIFHGLNTWNRKHWLTLMKYAKRLGRKTRIGLVGFSQSACPRVERHRSGVDSGDAV